MNTFLLLVVLVITIIGLTKGADWFLESAEKIGLALGLSHFIIGVTIVSFGTSFPELFTGVVAVLEGAPAMVPANAIGSNIANILLVVGAAALIGKNLVVSKNLIDLDLPLLAVGTVILLAVIYPFMNGGGEVTIGRFESIILVFGYLIYFVYSCFYEETSNEMQEGDLETVPSRKDRRGHGKEKTPDLKVVDFLLLILGGLLLYFSSSYLVEAVVTLSEIHKIAVGVISIVAVAIGTTLPELIVGVKAVREGDAEMALGNVFGSNIFNSLVVIGVPGLIRELPLDPETYQVGVPFMMLATILFIISGISRRVHAYEGAFYLLVYALFIIKIFGIL